MEFYIAQGISIITAIIAVITLQAKGMRVILAGHIISNVLAGSTYFLLNSFSGAGISFVAIAQSVIMYFYNRKDKKPPVWLLSVFVVLYVACSVFYYKSLIDIFPALAAVCLAVSMAQNSAKASRIWYLFNPLLWVIYDDFVLAFGNLAMHLIIFISTVIALIRVDKIFSVKKRLSH